MAVPRRGVRMLGRGEYSGACGVGIAGDILRGGVCSIFPIRYEGSKMQSDAADQTLSTGLRERVSEVLERIRPAIQSDGGDLELVEITEGGVVRIRLHGACVGCPSSSMTLHMGIEQNLREHVPEIVGVERVD